MGVTPLSIIGDLAVDAFEIPTKVRNLHAKFRDVGFIEDILVGSPRCDKHGEFLVPDFFEIASEVAAGASPYRLLWSEEAGGINWGRFVGCYGVNNVEDIWCGTKQRNFKILGLGVAVILPFYEERSSHIAARGASYSPMRIAELNEYECSLPGPKRAVRFPQYPCANYGSDEKKSGPNYKPFRQPDNRIALPKPPPWLGASLLVAALACLFLGLITLPNTQPAPPLRNRLSLALYLIGATLSAGALLTLILT
jgi:hypothetical protein